MAVFIVTYDLDQPGQNYDCVIGKLEALDHCHAQRSVWFVSANGTTTDLRNHLSGCLDSNDRLFVDYISDAWTGWNMPTCGKWLNDHGL